MSEEILATYNGVFGRVVSVAAKESYAVVEPIPQAKEKNPLLNELGTVFVDFALLKAADYTFPLPEKVIVQMDIEVIKFADGDRSAEAVNVTYMPSALAQFSFEDAGGELRHTKAKKSTISGDSAPTNVRQDLPVSVQTSVQPASKALGSIPAPVVPTAKPEMKPKAVTITKRYAGFIDNIVEKSPANIFAFISSGEFNENVFAPPAAFKQISGQATVGSWVSFTTEPSKIKEGQFEATNLKLETKVAPSEQGKTESTAKEIAAPAAAQPTVAPDTKSKSAPAPRRIEGTVTGFSPHQQRSAFLSAQGFRKVLLSSQELLKVEEAAGRPLKPNDKVLFTPSLQEGKLFATKVELKGTDGPSRSARSGNNPQPGGKGCG